MRGKVAKVAFLPFELQPPASVHCIESSPGDAPHAAGLVAAVILGSGCGAAEQSRGLRLTLAELGYAQLAAEHGVASATWDRFVRDVLVEPWLVDYRSVTAWEDEILEIAQREVVYLFDAAPRLRHHRNAAGDDRVVAAWGWSSAPGNARERTRMAGFLPVPEAWSGRRLDRGHLVAHAAGGGLDLNLFPQAAHLNRGRSEQGRLWRRMETYASTHPGTPLFVRPIYDGPSWQPAAIDYALLLPERLWSERFTNQP
jgi:hypothetical protein